MVGTGQQPTKQLVKANRWTKAVIEALLVANTTDKNDGESSDGESSDSESIQSAIDPKADNPVQTAKLEKLKALMAQPRTKRLVLVCPKSTDYGKGDLKAFLDEHFMRNVGNTDCTVEIRGRIRKEGYKFRDNSDEFKIPVFRCLVVYCLDLFGQQSETSCWQAST